MHCSGLCLSFCFAELISHCRNQSEQSAEEEEEDDREDEERETDRHAKLSSIFQKFVCFQLTVEF